MNNRLFFAVLLSLLASSLSPTVLAQNPNCKVRDQDTAGIYKGACKNGLAHGKGLAKGRDVFEGEFFEGDRVKGKYTWASGSWKSYEGEWSNETFHGKGKLIGADGQLIFEGEWKNGKMQGLSEQYKKAVAVACELDLGDYRVKVCGEDQSTNNFRCILEAQNKYSEYRQHCSAK